MEGTTVPAEQNTPPSPRSREPSFHSAAEDRGALTRGGAEQPAGGRGSSQRDPGATDVYDISNLGNVAGRSATAETPTSGAARGDTSAETMRRLSQQAMIALDISLNQAPPPPDRDVILNIDGTIRYEDVRIDDATDVRHPRTSDADPFRQHPVWKYKYYQDPALTTAERSPSPPPPDPNQWSGPLPRINPFGREYRNIAPGALRNPMPPPLPPFAQYDPRNGNWKA